MAKKLFIAFGIALIFIFSPFAKGEVGIPAAPNPARLVNDYAGVLKNTQQFEDSLESFMRSTSIQIVVVTVKDLGKYTPNEFATALGDKWGVGQKGKDNGLVILIKEKNDTKGEIYLAPGRGLEGVLPDAICQQITDDDILPVLRKHSHAYDKALQAGLKQIFPLLKGEVSKQAFIDEHNNRPVHEIIDLVLIMLGCFGGLVVLVLVIYAVGAYFNLRRLRKGKELKDPTIPKGIQDDEDLVEEYKEMLPVKPTPSEIAQMSKWNGFLTVLNYAFAIQKVDLKFSNDHKEISLYGTGHGSSGGGFSFGGGSFGGGGAGGSW